VLEPMSRLWSTAKREIGNCDRAARATSRDRRFGVTGSVGVARSPATGACSATGRPWAGAAFELDRSGCFGLCRTAAAAGNRARFGG
jgi:hypothetical protein